MFVVGQNADMDYRPQKVWRYKGHRILTWTEDDGVGAGLRRWFYKIDAAETVRAFAGGHEGDYEAWSCALQDACRKIASNANRTSAA